MKFFKLLSNPKPVAIDAIVIARIITGVFFIIHGHELFNLKAMQGFAGYLQNDLKFPYPLLMAYLRTGAEFFGGIMLLLGLFTRVGAFLIMITMLVATFTAAKGDLLGEGEFTFIYATLCFLLLIIGPGKYSVDFALSNRNII